LIHEDGGLSGGTQPDHPEDFGRGVSKGMALLHGASGVNKRVRGLGETGKRTTVGKSRRFGTGGALDGGEGVSQKRNCGR